MTAASSALSLHLNTADWQALWLTLKLCSVTTVILLLVAMPLAWWLAFGKQKRHALVEALVTLPLVLPPTVLGFYLLLLFSPQGFGQVLAALGLPPLLFSFEVLVIGSVIYSLPFAVQPLKQCFCSFGKQPLETAALLGAGRLDRFFHVLLPLSRPGLVAAASLTFAHTLGEFGMIMMIGGSIAGETKVLSVLIYDHTEAMNYGAAHQLSLLIVLLSVLLLFGLNRWQRRS